MSVAFSKKSVAMLLSRLSGFTHPNIRLEQYSTPSEYAAELLWVIKADVQGAVVYDLCCGTGILGIGAGLLGASKVHFIDMDDTVLKIAQDNVGVWQTHNIACEAVFEQQDVTQLTITQADIVVMNPPFGTKQKHADTQCLRAACGTPIICSIHKASTDAYIRSFMHKQGYTCVFSVQKKWLLRNTMHMHTRNKTYIDCCMYVFVLE
ncbi:MAG: METTL5 family protein [Candidatus Woesearchaeota archaeon]